MPGDSDDDYRLAEKMDGVYPPLLLLQYGVPERVPRLGTYETLDHLEFLVSKNEDFLDLVDSDSSLFERLKQGLKNELPGETGTATALATEPVSENDHIIERALINRAEFAARQMARLIICEPYMHADMEDKKGILCEAYNELTESLEFLERWGSQATLSAFRDKIEAVAEALRFGNLLGVDLENDPWNETPALVRPEAPVCGEDGVLPTTLQERSSDESGGSIPVSESQASWVSIPSPEKKNLIKKPKLN